MLELDGVEKERAVLRVRELELREHKTKAVEIVRQIESDIKIAERRKWQLIRR